MKEMMKKLSFLMLLTCAALTVRAQDVVNWTYSAKKIAEKTYELHFSATIQDPWRLYSQTTPAGGPLATKINFDKNPMVILVGKPKEVGRMEKKFEDAFDINVFFYHNQVDFVQLVKVKSAVITSVSGSIDFMACNESQCLPATNTKFKINLQ